MKPAFEKDRLRDFCRRWEVRELSIFGSALRADFKDDSDIDLLLSLNPDAPWSLYEWIDMIEELKEIFGRDIDLVSMDGLRNPFRRQAILNDREVIYAA
jgi:predicted nucleotidyltransferase